MKLSIFSKLVFCFSLTILASCGGGGGGGGSESSTTTINSRPSLGCFSNGTKVQAYNSAGTLIGTGTISSCDASITLTTGHTGPVIMKVVGAAGVTYFNEKAPDVPAPYESGTLMTVIPSATSGQSYGINVFTNLIAAAAGINPDTPSLSGGIAAITAAKTLALGVLGISEDKLGGDIFAAPVALRSKTDKINTSASTATLSLLIAEMGMNSSVSPAAQATTLFQLMKDTQGSANASVVSTKLSSISKTFLTSLNKVASGTSSAITQFASNTSFRPVSSAEYTAARTSANTTITAKDSSFSGVTAPGSSQTSGITVVPGLGKFSAGAVVSAYNATSGRLIEGATGTTDSTGKASLNLGSYSGSFIVKVTGATGVTYYDPGLAGSMPFESEATLLAMVPATELVSSGTSIGVTPLTHMAAGFALNSLDNLKIEPSSQDQTVSDVMLDAYAKTRLLMGLLTPTNASLNLLLNPLLAPEVLASSSGRINLGKEGGYWGVFFAELANAAANDPDSQRSLREISTSLFNNVRSFKAGTLTADAFVDLKDFIQVQKATQAMKTGTSAFINRCTTIDESISTAANSLFGSAKTQYKLAPTSTVVANMRDSFSLGLNYQLNANKADLRFDTAANCTP